MALDSRERQLLEILVDPQSLWVILDRISRNVHGRLAVRVASLDELLATFRQLKGVAKHWSGQDFGV
jgi:hypothetical protein